VDLHSFDSQIAFTKDQLSTKVTSLFPGNAMR